MKIFWMRTLLLILGFQSRPALAYIPDFQMILSRTAENHGRGLYQIEQDVVVRGEPDPMVVHETWWVLGEGSMRVQFEGRGLLKGLIHGSVVYDQTHRYWMDEQGNVRSQRLSDDWHEPFFHFRFSKNFKSRLVALKLAPPEVLKDRNPKISTTKNDGIEVSYPSQDFLRLGRSAGMVAWAVGSPTPVDQNSNFPGLWIEQDQFVISKFRLPTQTTVTADQYGRYTEGLWLPKTRQVTWDNNSAQVLVTSVKSLGKPTKSVDYLRTNSFDKKNPQHLTKWSEQSQLREFYQRFR